MQTCTHGSKPIFDGWQVCPHCDKPTPEYARSNRRVILLGSITVLGLGLLTFFLLRAILPSGCGTGSDSEPTRANPSLPVTGHRISGSPRFGCLSRAKIEELNNYLVDQDAGAFMSSLDFAVSIGTCTDFRDGESVFLEDTALFSGLVQVRRPGEPFSWWTYVEWVR